MTEPVIESMQFRFDNPVDMAAFMQPGTWEFIAWQGPHGADEGPFDYGRFSNGVDQDRDLVPMKWYSRLGQQVAPYYPPPPPPIEEPHE